MVNKRDMELIQVARKYSIAPGTFKCEVFLLFDQGFTPREVKFIMRDMKVDAYDRTLPNTISRYYYSDFIVRLVTGEKWLIETKGVEDVEVARKDARAVQWCRDASAIAGAAWQYVKVPYDLFQASTAPTFSELVAEIAVKEVS